jgi:hypothetical protein
MTTHDVQPKEDHVPPSKCWVTDPRDHVMRVEYLRYAEDSPVSKEFQASPHIAYGVDELEPHLNGKEIVVQPFDVGEPPFAKVAFTKEEGIFVEYMKFYPGRHWFND